MRSHSGAGGSVESSRSPGASATERASRLYDLVTERVLDWNGGGDTTDVWTLRSGNPVGLLAALFGLADVPCEWAVLNPAIAPELSMEPKSKFVAADDWSLPVLRVAAEGEGEPTWLVVSGSSRGMRMGVIPEALQGATAWVLEPGSHRTELLPREPAEDPAYAADVAVEYTALEDGTARVTGTFRNTMAGGSQMREGILNAEPTQRQQFARRLASTFAPGIDLENFTFPGLDVRGETFSFAFEGLVPDFLEGSGDRRTARLRMRPIQLAQGIGGADRTWPLALRVNAMQAERIRTRIVGGEAWKLGFEPTDQVVERDGFVYSLAVDETESDLEVTRTLHWRGATVPAAEVPELLAACERVDQAIDAKVAVDRRAP